MAKLEVLFVASEAAPLVKTGGLGDVAGALPAALAKLGVKVSLVIPAYGQIDKSAFRPLDMHGAHAWAGRDWPIEAFHGRLNNHDIYLLGCPALFERPGIYADQHGDYADNLTRFSFFCRAVIKLGQALKLEPQVLHVNDWQSALLPAILDTGAVEPTPLSQACKILTIHNLAYQGIFPSDQYHLTGLPTAFYNMEGIEFWGNISLLKAGIVCCDAINTVSPSYAAEIKAPAQGCGMDGILRKRGDHVLGIVNGADYNVWSPEKDPLLPTSFNAGNLKPKKICRNQLLQKLKLKPVDKAPVLGVVGRIAYQKGIDVMAPALAEFMAENDCRVVVLGSGEERYRQMLIELARAYPEQVGFISEFSESWAHLVQAGSDMLLMPSRYEPCGLSQLYAMRYGTIPVVHATGGLIDTVSDYNPKTRQGTGFMFSDYGVPGFLQALRRADKVFRTPRIWQALMASAMGQDFSWDKSAREYINMYEQFYKP